MRTRLFLFPIETSPRDFPYKLRLSNSIFKKGDIHIITNPWICSYISLLFRKINWIGQNFNHKFSFTKSPLSFYLKKRSSRIFLFDEECGFFYPEKFAYEYIENKYSQFDPSHIHAVFTWGINQHRFIKKLGFTSYCVGHPRFDPKTPYKENSNNNSILILTNFTLIMAEKDFTKEHHDTYTLARRNCILEDISIFFKFIKDNLDKDIYIRVHPSESRQFYISLFKSLPNVLILPRESLSRSFERSNELYHFNCTTALDSFSYKIKTTNLSTGKSTIIKDIPTSENIKFESQWLCYPSKYAEITNIIDTKSITKNYSYIFKYLLLLSLYILKYIYLIRIFLKGSYEKEKHGNFKFYSKKSVFLIRFNL